MGAILKFAAGFGVTALIISLAFGFIGGNHPVNAIITAIVCGIVGAGIGAGVYRFLQMRVPEILDAFQKGPATSAPPPEDYEPLEPAQDFSGGGGADLGGVDEPPVASLGTANAGIGPAVSGAPASAAFGDHILVNKIKIKNEPKLMAAAIRTLLAKDEK
jgi:hypothetical protein